MTAHRTLLVAIVLSASACLAATTEAQEAVSESLTSPAELLGRAQAGDFDMYFQSGKKKLALVEKGTPFNDSGWQHRPDALDDVVDALDQATQDDIPAVHVSTANGNVYAVNLNGLEKSYDGKKYFEVSMTSKGVRLSKPRPFYQSDEGSEGGSGY